MCCSVSLTYLILKDKKLGSGASMIGVYFNSNQIVLSDQFFDITGINCMQTLI